MQKANIEKLISDFGFFVNQLILFSIKHFLPYFSEKQKERKVHDRLYE